MSLREGLRSSGARAFVVLAIIVTLDNLQSSGLAVLAPNIQSSFHVSTGSDHLRGGHRRRLPRPGHLADGVAGRPVPACAHHRVGHLRVRPHGVRLRIGDQHLRVLPGALRRRHLPSQHQQRPRLPAGRYLPDQRARPALRGDGDGHRRGHGPQPASGGTHRHGGGWPERMALGLLHPGHPDPGGGGLRLPDPRAPAGQFEKKDVLGEVIVDAQPAAPSLEAAFERIMRIRTIKMVLIAFSAIGFGLFTVPVLGNLYLKQRFGLDAFQRGLIGTVGSAGVLIALPLVGRYYDRLYRKDPARALSLIGKVVLPCAVLDPDSVLHAERGPVGDLQRPDRGAPPHGLLHDRPGPHLGGSLSPARAGRGRRRDLRLLRRGHGRGGAGRPARQRRRPPGHGADHHDPLHHLRRLHDHPQRALHQQRPVPRGGRAPGGDGRSTSDRRPIPSRSRSCS